MLFYDGGRILVKKEDGIRYPTFAESGAGESVYLFTIDEEGFYLGDRSLAEGLLEKGYVFQNILDLRESPDGSSITGTRAGSSVEGAAHPWCRMKKSG